MNRRITIALVVVVALGVGLSLMGSGKEIAGQEHPKGKEEHPTANQEHPKEHPQEHPKEHPAEHPTSAAAEAVTKEHLATAIRRHIEEESRKNGGVYLRMDDKAGEVLRLTLKKVHDDKLASLGGETYFACADFKASNGKVYDLDVFMKGKNAHELMATEVTVHKEEGVERYTWLEEQGVWRKVKTKKK